MMNMLQDMEVRIARLWWEVEFKQDMVTGEKLDDRMLMVKRWAKEALEQIRDERPGIA